MDASSYRAMVNTREFSVRVVHIQTIWCMRFVMSKDFTRRGCCCFLCVCFCCCFLFGGGVKKNIFLIFFFGGGVGGWVGVIFKTVYNVTNRMV